MYTHKEELEIGLMNVAGHCVLMQIWAEHLLDMYGKQLRKEAPELAQRLHIIRTSGKATRQVLGRYINTDKDSEQVYIEQVADIFKHMRQAPLAQRAEALQQLDNIIQQLQTPRP